MKRNYVLSVLMFLGVIFCFQSVFADALDNWHWRNPLPNGNPQAGPHTLYGIIFANGKFFGVGDSGTVSISPDGTNWTESATATANKLNAIIYGGGLFLAAGDGGAVETSPDGTNWTLQASGTTNSLVAAAYANGNYVMVGGKAVITSSDAVTWSPSVSGLNGAAGVAGGSAGFVAIAGFYNGGSNQVFYSSNGSTWTSQALTVPGTGNPFFNGPLQNMIVTYANGAYLVGSAQIAGSEAYNQFIFRSTDGNYWTTNVLGGVITYSSGFAYNFFLVGNGEVIAAGKTAYPFLQFSTDGINWSTTNNLPDIYEQGIAGAYGNGNYVIVAPPQNNTYPLPPIFTSTDGLNWVNQQHPPTPPTGPTGNFTSIASTNGVYVVATSSTFVRSTNGLVYLTVSNSPALASVITYGNGFVGVGSGGNIYVSGDGLAWTQRNSGTLSNLRGAAAGSGLIAAVGDNGAIQTSPTGTIWTSRTSGTSLTLYGLAYANGLYVAVGYLGTVLTSPDGVSWTGQDSGTLTNLLSVTYGPAGFAAVGPGGTIITSLDGVNWTQQNSGTLASFESITFGNGYYLATGNSTVVMTSPDGIQWISCNTGATGGQNFYGSAFLNNRFDVVGSGGTILESDTIAPLFYLQIHTGGLWLTAFAPPGSNFRIQTCTNLATPVWSDAASFNNAPAVTQWTNSVLSPSPLFYRSVSP